MSRSDAACAGQREDESDLAHDMRLVMRDVGLYSRAALWPQALRGYQLPAARAIARSVLAGGGMEYAVVFSRQSGKDELLAQLCAWLLTRHQETGGTVIVATPTLRPQGLLTRDRLLDRLRAAFQGNAGRHARLREGNVVQLGRAQVRFLSAAPSASSRGNTADLLLVANEAQDIVPDTWDAVFAPMAASTNATTVFLGTVWSSDTLLARQLRLLSELERADGVQRIFRVPWRVVARELPPYGDYVRRQMALLGEQHPFIRTEYELEELDGSGGLFPAERRESLRGPFRPLARPAPDDPPNTHYAFTIDVAGEEEDGDGQPARRANPHRDSTALSVIRVSPPSKDAAAAAGAQHPVLPTYEVVARYVWTGTRHVTLHERIVTLARVWGIRRAVIDATGVGTGLTSFLSASLGERVVTPFIFTSVSKSQLAWDLIGLIDAGRLQVYTPAANSDPEQHRLDRLFWQQLTACRYTVLPGPGKLLRWSVEDPSVHDDLLMSLALVAVLDRQDWRPREARGRV